MNKKYVNEGLVVIVIGFIFLMLALSVPKNPVVIPGWINIVVQAKTIPTVTGIATIVFGAKLLMEIAIGKVAATSAGIDDKKNMVIVLVSTLVYLISIIYYGFLIPTIAYFIFTIYMFNRKERSIPVMLAYIVVYSVVAIYIVPMAINIRLP